MARLGERGLRKLGDQSPQMIRIDAAWLAAAPIDMRGGTDAALARVVAVFGAAQPHTAYIFANKRANRIKVLVHDGFGIWLAARRLHQGKFIWAAPSVPPSREVSHRGRSPSPAAPVDLHRS